MTTLIKVYLRNNQCTKEIRQFKLYSPNTRELFPYLWDMLIASFPELKDKNFTITYKDEEDDEITITNSQDLCIAVENRHDKMKLYVNYVSKNQDTSRSERSERCHPYIECDACDGPVIGFRYKCIQCDNYDLCSKCEALGLHHEHCMVRLPQPLKLSSAHGRRLLRDLRRKFVKKDGVPSSREHTSHEHPKRGRSRHASASNYNMFPWLEAFAPFFSFEEQKAKEDTSENANANACGTSLKISKKDITRFLDPFGIDIDIEVDSDSSTETKKSKRSEATDKDDTKKFPGEGKKLIDQQEDNKTSKPETASISNQNTSAPKNSSPDEWTVIDKIDSLNISRASSVASALNETTEVQAPAPTSLEPSAPAENSSKKTIYPQLPKEEEKVYHPNPKIQNALQTMVGMGFSNKGGLLTYLLEAENGNINRVLDLLKSEK